MDLDQIVSELKSERTRLDRAITALETNRVMPTHNGAQRAATVTTRKRRAAITPAGRRRIAEAMRKRWADWRRASRKMRA